MDVHGKTILVTGAGRGIGRSLALHFARKGANLALLDTNGEEVADSCVRCTEAGAAARSYVADAANEDSVVGALDQVTADFGRLDGLINNAGIVRDALLVKVKDGLVVGKMTLAQWQAVIDVNLTGVFLCAREAAQAHDQPRRRRRDRQRVEHLARRQCRTDQLQRSQGGRRSDDGGVAKELARYGIRVGAVARASFARPCSRA